MQVALLREKKYWSTHRLSLYIGIIQYPTTYNSQHMNLVGQFFLYNIHHVCATKITLLCPKTNLMF